jgi:hypothetical protein
MVRIGHKCDITTAQAIVDELVERKSPLLWHEGDVTRVLDPSLKVPQQVLLVLHHFAPDRVEEQKLFRWIEYSSISDFRTKVLRPLHEKAFIDYRGGSAVILPPGNASIEAVLREKRAKAK